MSGQAPVSDGWAQHDANYVHNDLLEGDDISNNEEYGNADDGKEDDRKWYSLWYYRRMGLCVLVRLQASSFHV